MCEVASIFGENSIRPFVRRCLAPLLLLFTMFQVNAVSAQEAVAPAGAATNAAMRYVIYYNSDASPPTSLLGKPYSHVILSFITAPARLPTEAPIKVVVPGKLTAALDAVASLQAEGKKVLISFGGGDMQLADYVGVANRETELAAAIASFVGEHGFAGVDIDFEVSQALYLKRPSGIFNGRKFLIDLTTALRSRLPQGALLTHVPQAPYLDPSWQGGPYLDVLREVGDMIDWITVQYYNNPTYDAPVAPNIVGHMKSPVPWSYTGLVLGAGGFAWSPEKLLVGLPVYRDDAANGHLAPRVVGKDVVCPLLKKFGNAFGGLTGWQFSTLTRDHRYWNKQMTTSLTGGTCPRKRAVIKLRGLEGPLYAGS